MIEAEQWKTIEGHPSYRVSNMGRVMSLKKPGEPKILKQYVDRYGYCWVKLSEGKNTKAPSRVTTLVADAWIGPMPDGLQRAHENGDSTDNRADNISYKSCLDNNRDRYRHGTMPKGEMIHNSLLTYDQAREIFLSEEPDTVLAIRYDIARYAIWAVKNRRSWKHATQDLDRSHVKTRRAKYGEVGSEAR